MESHNENYEKHHLINQTRFRRTRMEWQSIISNVLDKVWSLLRCEKIKSPVRPVTLMGVINYMRITMLTMDLSLFGQISWLARHRSQRSRKKQSVRHFQEVL